MVVSRVRNVQRNLRRFSSVSAAALYTAAFIILLILLLNMLKKGIFLLLLKISDVKLFDTIRYDCMEKGTKNEKRTTQSGVLEPGDTETRMAEPRRGQPWPRYVG